ncbi:hypothetical protein NNJEOMEG_02102 [Fundidesulfovibrio magnetotacticus]|uniref:Lipoprotein n=1 Tax=Fundidesulfovibrio magnetotacticus TaxID=2730080 RepID=A0A6V8LTJ6_9BACT|nr:hypothetical protein [Fundidesulfovibrio magnetotacticus]GFK94260.1 hypothetical protein NNJEOMEG_02102 [Fundidesulfovibrio magnetotacticus]
MRTHRYLVLIALLALLAAGACARRPSVDNKINPQFNVAVAPFSVAQNPWDLLAGYLPERVTPPKADAMDQLDTIMAKALPIGPDRNVFGAARVVPCVDSVKKPQEANRMATLKYWQDVGRCADVQYLVVPKVIHWKEREGSAVGSTSPAWVILDLYLVNVKTGGLINHFHYDYQQRALSDNLLDADKFLKRKGQWVTAAELAREAIEQGLKEFGL